jgi:hypothetical protein
MFGAIHASHKETDIYRVFQTGDLANLDALSDTGSSSFRITLLFICTSLLVLDVK